MRIDSLYSSNSTKQANITVGRGHVNGIYINTSRNDYQLTVRLRHKNGNTVLVPNIQIVNFGMMADYMFGACGDNTELVQDMFLLMMDALPESGAKDIAFGSWSHKALQASAGQKVGKLIRIELGSLYLNDGDELSVDFTCPEAGALYVSSFSDSRRPHEVISYELTNDTNATYHKVQSIFAFAPQFDQDNNIRTAFGYDLTYKIKDSIDTILCNQLEVFTASRILGRYEWVAYPHFGLLWANTGAIPETVSVQMSGNDAKTTALMVVRKEYIQSAVSSNTLLEAEQHISRIEKLEKDDPETAKALRHAGVIEGHADELKVHLQQVKATSN